MKHRPLILALILCGMAASAAATTPKEQFAADSKQAAARYAADKKLCSEESSSSARMQCLRDAKGENDKAISAAKAALTGGPKTGGLCVDCGKVASVDVSEKAGDGGAIGVIAGGVAGALLGHQVGGGTGKDIATLAGAAGGAYAGNKIEKKINSSKVWTVHVVYEDGNRGSFNFDHDPGMKTGDSVKKSGTSVVRR
jgi:outer membrane lipoprotein SlyB